MTLLYLYPGGAVLVARVNVRFIVILHDDVVTINFFDVHASEKRVTSKVKIGEDDPPKELKNYGLHEWLAVKRQVNKKGERIFQSTC